MLETAIQENTAAIRELIARLSAGAVVSHAASEQESAGKKSRTASAKAQDKPADTSPSASAPPAGAPESSGKNSEPGQGGKTGNVPPAADAATDAAHATDGTAQSAAAGDAQPVTYQQAAKAVTALAAAKGRPAAVAVLEQFGVAKLPDVKPEQYEAVVAACEAAGD